MCGNDNNLFCDIIGIEYCWRNFPQMFWLSNTCWSCYWLL